MFLNLILSFLDLSTIALIAVLTVLIYLSMPRRPGDLPPGPPVRLPFLGNLLELSGYEDQRIPLRRLRNKYGNIYSLYMGSKTFIFLNGYDTVKEAFVKNGDVFSDRPSGGIIETLNKGHGILGSSGKLWREQRKFSLVTLRDFNFGKSGLESKIHEEIIAFCDYLATQNGAQVNIWPITQTSIANIISSIIFGGNFKQGDPEFANVSAKMTENFQLTGGAGIVNIFPFLGYLPGDLFKFKRVLANFEYMLGFFRTLVDAKLTTFDENNIEDFAGAYIREMKVQQEFDKETSFNEKQLVATILDFFVGGTETTSTAIQWAVLLLINYPDSEARILREIEGYVGQDRLPSLQDRPNLVYTEAFIMEVLRYANLGIISVPHATPRDIVFKGYRIPKDASIIVDFDSITTDPGLWGDPEQFRPERFISHEGKLLKPEYFIPFSIGRRSCVAETLARMELFLFVSAMVQKFHFHAPVGEDLSFETKDGIFGLVHTPKPFRVVINVK